MNVLNKLPPRERQIVDLLFERGDMAVAELCDALPDPLSGSAVRAMLKRLEDKGFVRRAESERGFIFSPTMSDAAASKTALSSVVKTFFNGSAAGAATALLGMSGSLDAHELDELEAMIARARAAKGDA
jgi:predicted transcriptional regulator